MCVYISMPVGLFLLFNYPPWYEKTIIEGRKKLARYVDIEGCKELERLLEKKQQEIMAREIEDLKKNKPISD